MKTSADHTGLISGQITVLHRVANSLWRCRCTCGHEWNVHSSNLLKGQKSCRACRPKAPNFSHGKSKTRTYGIWQGMIQRCTNQSRECWKDYGGRGIRVCERWLNSYECFLFDMGERPARLSLDRINNDGDYERGNCRWASQSEQNRNQRRASPAMKRQARNKVSAIPDWGEDGPILRFRVKLT